jgi:Uncharacterized protein containing a von Willebrand factor type A (vWA) domain
MNITTRGLYKKARKAVPTLMLLLMAIVGMAQHYDITLPGAPPADPPEFHKPVNQDISGATIGVSTAAATVVWDFAAVPGGATINADNFVYNGVTVRLPANAGDNVSSASNVTLEGHPTATTSFTFTLIVADANNLATTATGTFEVFIERNVDVVMVLDRSGSMSLALGAGTRWSALRQSVQNFMLAYETLRPQDRTSISYFDTDLNPLSTCCGALIPNTPSNPALSARIASELNEVTNQPQGLTAMGMGLQNATTKLTDADRSRNILLITDGEQNVPPMVNANGQGYNDGTNIPDGIRIATIGIGNPSPQFNTILQNLASNSDGSYNTTIDGNAFVFQGGNSFGDLSSGFGNNFMTMLQDNSPQIIDKTSTAIPANNTPVTLQEFPLNKAVNKLLLEFVVPRSFEVPQLAQLLSRIRVTKDGTPVTQFARPVFSGNYTNTILLLFDFRNPRTSSTLKPEGKWSIAISDSILNLGFCKLTSIADDHRLHMKRTWGNKNPKVKDDFPLTVNMDWLGYPVKDAKVEVLFEVPGTDWGKALAEAPNVKLSDSADAGAPGVQKFNQLWATDSNFRKALEATGNLVTLTHTGNGKYEGAFKNLPVAGVYRLIYRISGKDSAAGEFQRFISESFYTSFSNVDLTKSNVTTVIQDGRLVMNLKPFTTYGVPIGPAAGTAFSVTNPAIRIANVVDHQDGSYTITFEGNINDTTSIQILGQTVHTGKLQDAGKGGSVIDRLNDWLRDHGIPVWLFWLVLLLLLILILWFIFRKKN